MFFQGSEQADIYEFLALPIIKGTFRIFSFSSFPRAWSRINFKIARNNLYGTGVVNGVNGAIITYGQVYFLF